MLDKKIAFIGSGVMAEAMIAGLLRKKLARPDNITAFYVRRKEAAQTDGSTKSERRLITLLRLHKRMWSCFQSNRSD